MLNPLNLKAFSGLVRIQEEKIVVIKRDRGPAHHELRL
jgi:hypothetical protein